MKRLFLSLIALLALSMSVYAQCTPDNSLTHSGIYPSTLPDAVANTSYSQVIQFKFPKDTTYQGFTVAVDSAHVDSIHGFPAGFSYQCGSSRCTYPGGGTGCARITGNPTMAMVGNYTLVVYVTGYLHFNSARFPQQFSNNVKLNVESSSSIFRFASYTQPTGFELKQNYPNPFVGSTTIEFTSPSTQPAYFKVFSLLGDLVYEKEIPAVRGDNKITFDRNNLKNGLYFYSVQIGDKVLTKRMMIDNNVF